MWQKPQLFNRNFYPVPLIRPGSSFLNRTLFVFLTIFWWYNLSVSFSFGFCMRRRGYLSNMWWPNISRPDVRLMNGPRLNRLGPNIRRKKKTASDCVASKRRHPKNRVQTVYYDTNSVEYITFDNLRDACASHGLDNVRISLPKKKKINDFNNSNKKIFFHFSGIKISFL